MLQKKLVLKRIKPGKAETFRAWLDILQNKRRQEAIDTLAAEQVLQETWFMAEIEGQWYAMAYLLSDGEPLPGDLAIAINKEHKDILTECLEPKAIITKLGCDLSV
jgi:hypothetical protein